MQNSMTRSLIETLVRSKLHAIKESPERTVRNLVDMALDFSYGRFQKDFFTLAQEMLHNENSPYYQLIYQTVHETNLERLVQFGMNIGYNSFTFGASRIRTLECSYGHNIPWCITLEINNVLSDCSRERYHTLINEGTSIGIYTWFILSNGAFEQFLPIMHEHKECAFIVFCEPKELTEALLSKLESILNLMVVVKYDHIQKNVYKHLQARELLYASYVMCGSEDWEFINKKLFLQDISLVHPSFLFLFTNDSCPTNPNNYMYSFVLQERMSPEYPMILYDFYSDNRRIDSIISNDSCVACFDKEGNLKNSSYNFHTHSLLDIFHLAFPKTDIVSNK